jgi:hypothetical protein
MEFIETPTFTRMVTELLSDDEYRALQNTLVENPERGDIIKGGGASASCAMLCKDVARAAGSV